MTQFHSCWLGAVLVLFIGTAPAGAATNITLREHATLESSVVRLGDVAEVVSADRSRTRQLAAMPLMPAPSPGGERFLRRREVEDLLAAHGEDLRELRIDGAQQVSITAPATAPVDAATDADGEQQRGRQLNRHAAILAGQIGGTKSVPLDAAMGHKIRDEIQRTIVEYLSTKTTSVRNWTASCHVSDRDLVLLRAATSPLVCLGGREPWTGRQRFVLSFATAQGAVRVPVFAEVTGSGAPVVVAVQPIPRGAVITAADVELQQFDNVPVANSRRSPLQSIENLVGMEARQALQAGSVIFTDQVQSPMLVKRGEVITVSSQGGGIRVRTTARARQDGAKGDLVQVESLDTKERYDARVVGPHQAAVYATTVVAPTEPTAQNNPQVTVPRPGW